MSAIALLHLSDLHFGRDADLAQVEELERLIPALGPDAVVIAGDISQRARHGEFQRALAFVQCARAAAPVLVIPGNHDVQWWWSPWSVAGQRIKWAKYRRYFGDDLSPRLIAPGMVIASALTSHGVAPGSMTWNLNDMAVRGHLPSAEVSRLGETFRAAPDGALRVAVLHHNVLKGQISRRWGLARPHQAQRRLEAAGADLVLCGHDHQEGAGQLEGGTVVSTASTHTWRTRGHRPSAFNVVRADEASISVQHMRWDAAEGRFVPSDLARFVRRRRSPDQA